MSDGDPALVERIRTEITRFNEHGSRTPIIVLQVWPFEDPPRLARLAPLLDRDQPFITVPPPPRAVAGQMTTVESFVDYMCDQLRRVAVPAPYRLYGWSFAGSVAIGVAERLGDDVESVVTLDTWPPHTLRPVIRVRRLMLAYRNHRHMGVRMAVRKAVGPEVRAEQRMWKGHFDEFPAVVRPNGPRARRMDDQAVASAGIRIALRVSPMQSVRQPTAMIVAAETERMIRFDPLWFWRRYLPEDHITMTVPGGHFSMFDAENVRRVAWALERWVTWLDRRRDGADLPGDEMALPRTAHG